MAEARPAFLLYADDWLSLTGAMEPAATGALSRFLSHQWRHEGLPTDEASLQRLSAADTKTWRRIWPQLRPLLVERESRFFYEPLEQVRRESAGYSREAQRLGKLGGRASAEARRLAKGTAAPQRRAPRPDAASGDRGATVTSTAEPLHEPLHEPLRRSGDEPYTKPSSSSSSSTSTEGGDRLGDRVALRAVARQEAPAPEPNPTRPLTPLPVPRNDWLSLADCWNRACSRVPSWTPVSTSLQPASQARLLTALRTTPDLDAWDARFARAAASGHLTGSNGKGFVSTLWWLLEHVDELDAGQYDDRQSRPQRVAALAGGGVPVAARIDRWECHHTTDRCLTQTACELRTAKAVGRGLTRLEDVPARMRDVVADMAPAYAPKAASA